MRPTRGDPSRGFESSEYLKEGVDQIATTSSERRLIWTASLIIQRCPLVEIFALALRDYEYTHLLLIRRTGRAIRLSDNDGNSDPMSYSMKHLLQVMPRVRLFLWLLVPLLVGVFRANFSIGQVSQTSSASQQHATKGDAKPSCPAVNHLPLPASKYKMGTTRAHHLLYSVALRFALEAIDYSLRPQSTSDSSSAPV